MGPSFSQYTKEAIAEHPSPLAFSGERVSLAQLTQYRNLKTVPIADIRAKKTSRYIAIKYSVRGIATSAARSQEAIEKGGGQEVQAARPAIKIDWAGEYESQQRSAAPVD